MDETEIEYAVEGLKRIHPQSYKNFKMQGRSAIHILDQGMDSAPSFATAEQILEESSNTCLNFTEIVNFMGRAGLLETWNDSVPFRFITEEYDPELVKTAYHHVSGTSYTEPNTVEYKYDDELLQELRNPIDEGLNSIDN